MADPRNVNLNEAQSGGAPSLQALTFLTTMLGLQLMRVFMPTLLFYLGEVRGLSTPGLGGVGLLVFMAPVLAAPLQRVMGVRTTVALVVAGTAVLRVVEQISLSPSLDFALGAGGTALFLIFVPLALGATRSGTRPRVTEFALALLLGVAGDSALHIAAGTYDLSWQGGVWPMLLVVVLAFLALAALIGVVDRLPRRVAAIPWRRAWPLLAFGPWLALQLIIFQNAARAAAVTGWSLPAAGFVVTVGNVLGLIGAAWAVGRLPGWAAWVAGIVLVLVSLPLQTQGVAAALLIVVGQILVSALLVRAIGTGTPAAAAGGGLGRTVAAFAVGQLLLTLLFFAYNAAHSLALPFTEVMVVPFMALFVGLPAGLAPSGAAEKRQPGVGLLAAAGAVLLLAPVGLALTWQAPRPVVPPGPVDSLRVLDYNLHNGFNVNGRLDMEALAQVIEESGADVVILQEVSRGWVVAGSLDMLSWLAQRLDMVAVSGPTTTDRQWGNAILSRYPILAESSASLPSEGLPLRRGYLQAEIDTGAAPVSVISTHLHHIIEEGEVRELQVAALLADWDAAPRTVIAGDLNAPPESAEIRMLVDAGLVDVAAALGIDPGYTSPADDPMQRIDYILLSPDLTPEAFWLLPTTASDHLPLLAVVGIPAN